MPITMRAPLFLEDIAVGDKFVSETLTVDEASIKEFAGRYDPQPFHLDDAAARNTLFKGLAASGWHTGAMSMRLIVQSVPIANGVVGAGVEVAWPTPTRPGDVLHVESTITAIAPSRSKPGQAIVTCQSDTLNQAGACVQRLTAKLLVFSRQASTPSA